MTIQIHVGIPLYNGKVHPKTQESLVSLDHYNKSFSKEKPGDYSFSLARVVGTSSLFARNIAAGKGCKKVDQILDYDFYLSLDGDIGFTIDSILRLVRKYNELKESEIGKNIGIIGAAYNGNDFNTEDKLIAGKFSDMPGISTIDLWIPLSCTECIEVDWIGTGFMLVAKDVLESLPYPWFRSHVILNKYESEMPTEDICICMDVKSKLSRSIWCDGSNRVIHFSH
jgi:hypothetical protein